MFVIAFNDEWDGKTQACYWTCRFGDTDNYTLIKEEATVFKSRSAAMAMIQTLGVEHYLVEVCT